MGNVARNNIYFILKANEISFNMDILTILYNF